MGYRDVSKGNMGDRMFQPNGYAQSLRVIGQALETLKSDVFEMEHEGDDYLVRGNVLSRSSIVGTVADSTVEYVWGIVSGRVPVQTTDVRSIATSRTQIDLCYTQKDLQRLDQEGRAKRSAAGGISIIDDLSQLLRTIGAYLDQKPARLLKITREGESFLVQYEMASGQRREETVSASTLYDFWVEMCMKRKSRTNGDAASER